jgi:hypothetical protein
MITKVRELREEAEVQRPAVIPRGTPAPLVVEFSGIILDRREELLEIKKEKDKHSPSVWLLSKQPFVLDLVEGCEYVAEKRWTVAVLREELRVLGHADRVTEFHDKNIFRSIRRHQLDRFVRMQKHDGLREISKMNGGFVVVADAFAAAAEVGELRAALYYHVPAKADGCTTSR